MQPTDHAPAGDLRAYILAKQEVTDLVRAAATLEAGPGEIGDPYRELLVRLAEDRFDLAVVGQFKRGKSTLLNAIVGREALPTGVVPLTSAITSLTYGPRPRAILRWQGRGLQQEVSLAELPRYVTERGNPGNERGLAEAVVELPVAILRRGIRFVDTPGVGSSRDENTATTMAFLPDAAAVIFVTSADGPMGEIEERFLQDVRAHVRKLLVVVNKVDLVSPDERAELLGFVRSRLAARLGTEDIPVVAVSAARALSARLGHDGPGTEASGIAAFEDLLVRFVAEERGRTFLVAILDRLLGLLGSVDRTVSGGVDDMPGPGASLREQVAAACDRLLLGGPLAGAENIGPAVAETVERLDQAVASRTPEASARAPRPTSACPVCAMQAEAVFAFLARWQYALTTDAAARAAFLGVGGFCAPHTWQLQQIASPRTLTVAYVPLVEAAVQAVRQMPEDVQASAAPGDGRAGVPDPDASSCAVCRVLVTSGAAGIGELLDALGSPEGRDRYGATDGLCLPHLRRALARSLDAVTREWLVETEARRLEELSEDLHAYALKRDAIRRGLINDREEGAWRRAIATLVGERTVSAPGVAMQDEL
jgi:GTP-binding protein EngB required for normal cell division